MKEARARLVRQRKSRALLAHAVARFVALRGADGAYRDTVPAVLTDGTRVTVLLELRIVPTIQPEESP